MLSDPTEVKLNNLKLVALVLTLTYRPQIDKEQERIDLAPNVYSPQ